MISVELWRARIGLFNSKHYSGFLSSLFSSYVPFKFHRRRKRNTQEKTSTASQSSPQLAASNSSTDPSPAVTQESLSTSTSQSPSSASNSNSITSPDEPSALVSSLHMLQQFLLSSFTFSWTSLLPTSFPRGLLSGCLLREALVRLVLLIAIISQVLIISGDVETNPGPDPSTTPTLLKLIAMKGTDGNPLKIIEKITVGNYMTFGLYLLQDDNGQNVDLLKKKHINDGPESVTQAILQKWLTSDAPTRTYQHLIECLRQSELGALAECIEKTVDQGQPPAAGSSSGSVQPQPRLETATKHEPVVVPKEIVDELAGLRIAYADLSIQYEKELQNSPEAQLKLAEYLPWLFPSVNFDCKFPGNFKIFINGQISLFNIHYLKLICTRFPPIVCTATLALSENYEEQLKRFMTSTRVEEFKKLFPAPSVLPAGMVLVKLKLNNDWDGDTVADLNKFVLQLGVRGLHISGIGVGCIAVHLWCSTSDIEKLESFIINNAKLLKDNRVLQVFIEEKLVFNNLPAPPTSDTSSAVCTESDQSKNQQTTAGDSWFESIQVKPPMIFQHTMKQAGEIKIMQKADTKTKKEQAKQKQKLKDFQFRVMTYFQEQQEKEAQQNTPLPFQPTKYADLELMEIFRKYLEHVYQQRKKSLNFFEELPLDSSDEEFISLCLIDSYDSSNKKKIRLCDLDKIIKEGRKYTSTKPAKGMLVEGAAGVGKSTFAWKCCQKWANGELLQDWSIVIFIQLCNQRVREARILSDFIYYPEQAVREKICQKLVASKGRKVLFVVDSFDQVNEQQMNGTVFQQLVDNELLPYATLIVLSRPMKSRRDKTLLGLVSKLGTDQHIKISGFNIDHYIASACSDELLAALKSYLSSHPLIYSQMCIPIHCVVIKDLFCLHWNHGDKGFSPNTLTELYTDLVRTLLLRYLSCDHEYSQREWVIEEFTDLPDKANEFFMALAQLAAKGIEEGKYAFDKPTDFGTLDLIQKVRKVYPESDKEFCSDKEYYCFLHLTLQEYLSAYYCSLQEKPTETLQTLLKQDHSQQGFPIRPDIPHSSILSHYRIDSSISKKDHCTVVLFAVGISKRKMFQALSESIETHINNTQVFPSLHLLYETQSHYLIRQIFSTLEAQASDSNQVGLLEVPHHNTLLDSFVAGYCIAHSNRLWLLDNEKFSESIHTFQEHFQAFSYGLNMSSDQCIGHIVVMKNVYDGISSLKLLHPHTQKLTELSIGIPEDSDEAYTDFPLFYPLLKTLKVKPSFPGSYLKTSEVNTSFSISFVSLLENLPFMRSLKMLCIELPMISEVADANLKQLMKCHTLQKIEIKCKASAVGYTGRSKGYRIPPFAISSELESLCVSCFALTSDPFTQEVISLKTLKLCSCEIPDNACVALICFLQSQHCVLETFELYDPHHLQYGIPDKLLEGIVGSSHTLRRCVFDRCSGSIVRHLVAGMKKSESQSRLEELTVICSSCSEYDYEYFNELIRVVNEHTTISLLRLNDYFEEFVRDHDIRSSLTVHTNCSYTSS